MASKISPLPMKRPREFKLGDRSTSDARIEYRERPGADVLAVWHVHAEKLCAQSIFFAACLNTDSAFRESKQRTISLHEHPGGVNVISMVLHYAYTGECNASKFTTDLANNLLLRLQLFILADFLRRPDVKLQDENMKCFTLELKENKYWEQLPAIASLLYTAEHEDVAYIRECRKLLASDVASRVWEPSQEMRPSDREFWDTFRSNVDFAEAVGSELVNSNIRLVMSTIRLRGIASWMHIRMPAAARCLLEDRPEAALKSHMLPPGVGEHEYCCSREFYRGYFTAKCMVLDPKEMRMSCPYCHWSGPADVWDPHEKRETS